MTSLTTLDRILAIPDKSLRQSELVKCAKSLGANPVSAHKEGDCNEEMLVLLIYDAQKSVQGRRERDLKFVAIGLFVLAGVVALVGMAPNFFVGIFEAEQDAQMSRGKTLQAFDKEGKPMMEDNKPVLFKLMDGVYHEYDEARKVTYEYNYQAGALISKKTLDKQGKVIGLETYD
jgi:hypothetical protein